MKKQFLREGDALYAIGTADIKQELPKGNYRLVLTQRGPALIDIGEIRLPSKIYSSDKEFIYHVVTQYEKSEQSVGVALVGEKGLGKSLTTQILAQTVNQPVIYLDRQSLFPGILEFLDSFKVNLTVVLDEFEKIVPIASEDSDKLTQESMLTFLDSGTARENKHLILLTSNSSRNISEFFKSRPSRIRYYREYKQLSEEIIVEIIDDLLKNSEHKEDLLTNLVRKDLNIDVLIQIIKEVNTSNKPYSSFKDFFNFLPVLDFNWEVSLEGLERTFDYSLGKGEWFRLGDYEVKLLEEVSPINRKEGIHKVKVELWYKDEKQGEREATVEVFGESLKYKMNDYF